MLRISSSATTTSNMTDEDGMSSLADDVILPNDDAPPSPFAPLKHNLVPICTIGTGTFGRVELTRHRITGSYYAIKSMYMPTIIAKRQVDHVHNEKRILERLSHPFIVQLYDTAKDNKNLYVILEFLSGGELFSYLRMSKTFPSYMVRFYAAEITLALSYLHLITIAYRDLKPENLMVTHDGHIKLTDFGFAKEIHNKSYTICGTAEYMAPEVIARQGHDHSIDWWALGILIFELMAGRPPFPGHSTAEIYENIQDHAGIPDFPRKTFSTNAKDVIISLLKVDPKQRLGYGPDGSDRVKKHCWFASVDWDRLLNKAVPPPLEPTVYHEGDTGNFDSYDEADILPPAPQRDLDLFDEW